MNLDERMERSRTYSAFRTTLDMAMGAIYVLMGIFTLGLRYFGTVELPATTAYLLGGLLVVYGAFRIYRGLVAIWGRKKPRHDSDRA